MFSRSASSILALDLSPDAVRAVEVVFRKDVPQVTALGTQALPAGSADSLPERHLAALETVISAQRLRSRRCIATLPTTLIMTRSVAIDTSKPTAVNEQIRLALQNSNSRDTRELIFDFWTVSDASKNGKTQEVLVVATHAPVVQRYLDGFKKLRLTCEHLDVSPCALTSLVTRLVANPEVPVGTVVLCENAGYFAVVEQKRVLFWRPFDLPSHGRSGAVVQAGLERVGDEISKCVSHMAGSQYLDALTELFVFGHGADSQGFAGYLTQRFNLPVRTPSPFESLPATAMPETIRATLQPAAASHYAAALGLALQSAGGPSHG